MFQLRWSILRQPWNQPPGSEQDELEDSSFHRIALLPGAGIVGTGRLHITEDGSAQIRYMAVREKYQGMGVGQRILNSLEAFARSSGIRNIRLNARELAQPFYQSQGYEIVCKSYVLFGVIQHITMQKNYDLSPGNR